VGVVDGDVITLSDVDEAMTRYGKVDVGNEKNPLDKEIRLSQARREVLEMLIEERLLRKAARSYGIKVKDEEVDKAIERVRESNRMTNAQMERELARQGFTLEAYRHFLRTQIVKARTIEYLIKPKISMDDEQIRAYYQRNIREYQRTSQVRVSHILVKVSSNATPEEVEMASRKMNRILQRLREGVKFEEVAMLYSEDLSARSGGDIGFFKRGEMVRVLEEVVFEMEAGEVSGVIRSGNGLHLLKVTEKTGGKPIPYEQIKERVTEQYYRAAVERDYAKWLADFRNRSNVEIKF
jgi:parvulin-like peptidyl-prolyl isomerase